MIILDLYKYKLPNGFLISLSDVGLPEFTIEKRLVAENGKILVCGDSRINCIDVTEEEISLWTEEDRTEYDDYIFLNPPSQDSSGSSTVPNEEIEKYTQIIDILSGEQK